MSSRALCVFPLRVSISNVLSLTFKETHGNQTQRVRLVTGRLPFDSSFTRVQKRRHKVEADEDAEQRQSARKKTKTTKVAKPLEHIVASKTGVSNSNSPSTSHLYLI